MTMQSINPIGIYQSYPAFGAEENNNSSEFKEKVNLEIEVQQAELKVKIITDMINANDVTQEQKSILQPMLNDANRDLALLKQKANIS